MDDNIGIGLMSVSHPKIRSIGGEGYSENEPTPETTPLLADNALQDEPHSKSKPGVLSSSRRLSGLIFYFMMIHFLLAFCDIILNAPLQRLFENSLCLKYYNFPESGVPEGSCKISEIQYNLAILRGWKSMFDNIPVLLVAIPMGRLGDHYGRRNILIVALVGVAGSLSWIFIVCAFPKIFPLRLVLISSAILLCGGGLNSASAFMWAMASESIPSDRRSYAFYYIFSAFYVAELIASFTAYMTTSISPWIPCSLALGSVILCLILLAFMADPRKLPHNPHHISSPEPESPETLQPSAKSSTATTLFSAISNPKILLTIPVFLIGIYRYTILNILIPYASIRFHTFIYSGALYYTETAIVNIILFLLLIPNVTSHVRGKYNIRPETIDLFLVRMSTSLMSVGALFIGLAPSAHLIPIGVSIFASGFGSRVSALSLISYWIPESSRATIYAAISVLESLGHAVGDPLMLNIFARSLASEGMWMAMPFFIASVLYALAIVSTTFIRLGKSEERVMGEEEVEEEGLGGG